MNNIQVACKNLREATEHLITAADMLRGVDSNLTVEIIDLAMGPSVMYGKVSKMLLSLDDVKREPFTIKCDFCDAKMENVTEIPPGWFRCRLRGKSDGVTTIYVNGPTCCPEHKSQLHRLTA